MSIRKNREPSQTSVDDFSEQQPSILDLEQTTFEHDERVDDAEQQPTSFDEDDNGEQQSHTFDHDDRVEDAEKQPTAFDHDDRVNDVEQQQPTLDEDDHGEQQATTIDHDGRMDDGDEQPTTLYEDGKQHSDEESSQFSADEPIGGNDSDLKIDKTMLGQIYVDPMIAKLKITEVIHLSSAVNY